MAEIYRTVYRNHQYVIGVDLANVASVLVQKRDYWQAEQLYREALVMYAVTLPPGHTKVGLGRIKLGRTLLREGRFHEAAEETMQFQLEHGRIAAESIAVTK